MLHTRAKETKDEYEGEIRKKRCMIIRETRTVEMEGYDEEKDSQEGA